MARSCVLESPGCYASPTWSWGRRNQSLWQQITGEGIVGDLASTQLEFLPTATVTWAGFTARYSDGEVLSQGQGTGFGFNYGSNSYVGYTSRGGPFDRFFTDDVDPRFPPRTRSSGFASVRPPRPTRSAG